MELLTQIGRGTYPVGSYLPSAERLSIQKGVSVSTVRRSICLLNSIGAVKSSRPLGARVLPPSQSADNCDFSHPDHRRRLLDLAKSLQILALSGKAVCELSLASLDNASLCQWKQYLHDLGRRGHCERVIYVSLSLIAAYTPFQTLRTVYSELLRLLFWGNPLENFHCYSSDLETLLFHELRKVVKVLQQLGIDEAGNILIPEVNEF